MSYNAITRAELFGQYLPIYENTENGLNIFDPAYSKLAEAWDKLCDNMDQISGWHLGTTDDRIKMPLWGFGQDDNDPFLNVKITSFGVPTYQTFLNGDNLWYDVLNVDDVPPLLYAFRLFT